jgi:hypothetical protein
MKNAVMMPSQGTNIYQSKFHDDPLKYSRNGEVITANTERLQCR